MDKNGKYLEEAFAKKSVDNRVPITIEETAVYSQLSKVNPLNLGLHMSHVPCDFLSQARGAKKHPLKQEHPVSTLLSLFYIVYDRYFPSYESGKFSLNDIFDFFSNPAIAFFTSGDFTFNIGFLAIKTQSQPGSMNANSGLIAARINRFARFRLTAFPTERPAVTPTRTSFN